MLFEGISATAIVPKRGSAEAAGYDFYADENFVILPHGKTLIKTGIRTNFGPGIVLFLKSRSGLAVKSGVYTEAGVIDSDYKGEVCVALSNNTDVEYTGSIGDRISQGVFLRLADECYPAFSASSDASVRGDSGFGSTGK